MTSLLNTRWSIRAMISSRVYLSPDEHLFLPQPCKSYSGSCRIWSPLRCFAPFSCFSFYQAPFLTHLSRHFFQRLSQPRDSVCKIYSRRSIICTEAVCWTWSTVPCSIMGRIIFHADDNRDRYGWRSDFQNISNNLAVVFLHVRWMHSRVIEYY